jgi:hypothetical protein
MPIRNTCVRGSANLKQVHDFLPCKALGRQVRMRDSIRRLLIGNAMWWYRYIPDASVMCALVALRHRFRYNRLGACTSCCVHIARAGFRTEVCWRHSGTRRAPNLLHDVFVL